MADTSKKKSDRTPAPREPADSRTKVYSVPVRSIVSNTNPRQALSPSLDSQGWAVFTGDKQLWPLATSDDPEERATYVKLIQDFDPELAAMAATMLTQGQLQPVEVREGGGGKYTLCYGCRRCLAILFNWCLLGKPKEPIVNATFVKGNENALLQRALVENIRKNPNPVEEARTIRMLLNNGQDRAEVARDLGMSVTTVANRLALLDLPPTVQKKVESGAVKASKALATEKNGQDGASDAGASHAGDTTPPDASPRLRKKKEIQGALEEFTADRPEHKVLAWVLGLREKIA